VKNKSSANKYAKALFNASLEQNSLAEVRNGLDYIFKISKAIPEFNHILFTKNITTSDKIDILSKVLSNNVDPLVSDLLLILMDNDQIRLFVTIMNKYNKLVNVSSKELDVKVTSQSRLSLDELGSIKTDLSIQLDSQININNDTDKSLIGGIQLRIGNVIIDNSVSNKLNKLKNNLKNNYANME
tara:strand:+ start:1602 stop:2156 length:555 start_codon:yes stop_codon:yes gene_type:complete